MAPADPTKLSQGIYYRTVISQETINDLLSILYETTCRLSRGKLFHSVRTILVPIYREHPDALQIAMNNLAQQHGLLNCEDVWRIIVDPL